MNLVGERVITLPCLGRPFRLGMLYDCRTDCIIPGMTLWDSKDLKLTEESMQSYQPSSSFDLIAEDSLADKTFNLGVEASLALSFMSGMVSVSGSAKYLTDRKESKKTSRVTLQFTCTSHFKELSMEHLGKLKYNDVFKKDIATHVVTGVVYGADAFFVFDREIEGKEDYQEVHGDMQIAIKSIPNIQIDGEGSLDIKDKEMEEYNKFHCKFYGDILLPENPTTFKGAVKVYQDLPDLIGIRSPWQKQKLQEQKQKLQKQKQKLQKQKENEQKAEPKAAGLEEDDHEDPVDQIDSDKPVPAPSSKDTHLMKNLKTVPKTVWLFPLAKLRSEGATIVCEISTRLVGESAKLLESLHDIQMRTNDLMKSKAFYNFQGIKHQLRQFKDLIAQYETYIMQQLSVLLPEIRGRGMEEERLVDIFQNNDNSPFKYFHLVSYLDSKEREIKVLEKCLEFMGKAEKKKEQSEGAKASEVDRKDKEPIDDSKDIEVKKSSIEFAFQTGEMDSVIYSFDHEYVLSFEFVNIEKEDPFLDSMQKYLEGAKNVVPVGKIEQIKHNFGGIKDSEKQKKQEKYDAVLSHGWYEDTELIDDMRKKVVQFKHFVQANSQSEKTYFALTDGSLKSKVVEPPQGPTKQEDHGWRSRKVSPTVEKKHWRSHKHVKIEGKDTMETEDSVDTAAACTTHRKGAMICLYEGGQRKEYSLPGKPGKVAAAVISSTSISLSWSEPKYGSESILHYSVSYCIVNDDSESEKWQDYTEPAPDTKIIVKARMRTKYKFRVRSVCKIGHSKYSKTSEVIEIISNRLQSLVKHSTLTSEGSLRRYTYLKSSLANVDEKLKIARCRNSKKSLSHVKTIIVTGLRPSSRQNLIDTIFNRIFNISWEDKTRFHLGITENEIDLDSDMAEWLKIFEIIKHQDNQEIDPFCIRIVEMPVGSLKYETNFEQLVDAFSSTNIDSIDNIILTTDVCKEAVSDTEFANLCHLLSFYGENLRNSLCLVYTGGNPSGLLERFAKIGLELQHFEIPYNDFMHPKPQQEVTKLSNTLEENIVQFIDSKPEYSKMTSPTIKVLRNKLSLWTAVAELHGIVKLAGNFPQDWEDNELVNTVKTSLQVIDNHQLLPSPIRSSSDIERCIQEIKPWKSEYLSLRKDLANLIEKIMEKKWTL